MLCLFLFCQNLIDGSGYLIVGEIVAHTRQNLVNHCLNLFAVEVFGFLANDACYIGTQFFTGLGCQQQCCHGTDQCAAKHSGEY